MQHYSPTLKVRTSFHSLIHIVQYEQEFLITLSRIVFDWNYTAVKNVNISNNHIIRSIIYSMCELDQLNIATYKKINNKYKFSMTIYWCFMQRM